MGDREGSPTAFEHTWKSPPSQFPGPQFLSVDDTKRSRASSDPGGLHLCIVPEITITTEDGRSSECDEDDQLDGFLLPLQQRPRSNTCPEEMFRSRKGRPPTPPPEDVQKIRNPAGKRFSFNFSPKDINGISFAQHRLSKVSEEAGDQRQKKKQPRKFSLQSEIMSHCSSSDLPYDKENCCNKMDNSLSRLNARHVEDKPVNETSIDFHSLFESVTRNSEITPNIDKHIPNRGDNADVVTCTPGRYRSKKDDRGNVESDHLISY